MKWTIEIEDKENIFRGPGDCQRCPLRFASGKQESLYCVVTTKGRAKCPLEIKKEGVSR